MKGSQLNVSNFYAQDIFPQWEKLIRKSRSSIVIFSPYINESLNELLNNVCPGINVEIYTRLDEDTICGNLKALRKAYNQGAALFHLPGLHAKILLVDSEFISMGSQNFTYGGRKNKEASFSSKFSFAGSEFLVELKIWRSNSTKITAKLLEDLDGNMIEECEKYKKRKRRFKKKIEEIKEKHKRKSIDRVTKVLANLTNYENNKYLICRQSQNLLKWEKKNTKLNKGEFYPIMNFGTKQMVFARVNKTRVSFIDNRKELGNVTIGARKFSVFIVFPKKQFGNGNVLINLKRGQDKIRLRYFFDGKNFKQVPNGKIAQVKQEVINELESNQMILYSLFKPFKPNVIVGKEHIVDKFASEERYTARIKIRKGVGFFIFQAIGDE